MAENAVVPVDDQSSLHEAHNRVVYRDAGNANYPAKVVWRNNMAGHILDVDNAAGNHANFGNGVLLVTDTGVTLGRALLFVDNLHDIGAVGATRPRNLYLAGLAVIGGVLTAEAGVALGTGLTTGAGQLAFPAVQNPSAIANTLDDYEEGVWTPSLGGSATYGAANSGAYIKVGRLVTVWGDLRVTTIGTGSTGTISGLPFAADRVCSGCVDFWSAMSAAYTSMGVLVASGGSGVQITAQTAALAANSLVTPLQNASILRFTLTYRTAL